MSYFAFLALFLLPPLLILAGLHYRDHRQQTGMPATFRNWSPQFALFAHVVVAFTYTTPWDNYLVATNVWWYDPDLVTGWVIGWVPIEEYSFFVLQTLFTGLWVIWLVKQMAPPPRLNSELIRYRRGAVAVGVGVWWVMAGLLAVGYQPATYLALIAVWALPPILLQVGFGGDVLLRHWRVVALGIVPTTVYLSLADTLAIGYGTWTIDPAQSLNIFLGGLPLEEAIFFLVTNTLVTLGMVLVMAGQSEERLENFLAARQIYSCSK